MYKTDDLIQYDGVLMYPSTPFHKLKSRRNSTSAIGAIRFLTKHPRLELKVSSAVWCIILRRHFGISIYDDSAQPLTCSHCQKNWIIWGITCPRVSLDLASRTGTARSTVCSLVKCFVQLVSAQLEASLPIPGNPPSTH